jgi:hypothetical protein
MKIGAIAAPATLATVYPASAGQRLIFEILNIFDVQCPRPLVTGMGTEGVAATPF